MGQRTNKVVACLWQGKDLPAYSADAYGVRDVLNLWRGVKRCVKNSELWIVADAHYMQQLLNDPDPEMSNVRLVPMQGHGCGGWTPIFEVFRPDLRPIFDTERHMLLGLDTVFWRDSTWLFNWRGAPVGLPPHPQMAHKVCNAVVTFDLHGADLMWEAYLREKARNRMASFLMNGHPSEMFLMQKLWLDHKWPMLEDKCKRLVSYKEHIIKEKRSLADVDVIYFHGHPKPGHLPPNNVIRMVWEGASTEVKS